MTQKAAFVWSKLVAAFDDRERLRNNLRQPFRNETDLKKAEAEYAQAVKRYQTIESEFLRGEK